MKQNPKAKRYSSRCNRQCVNVRSAFVAAHVREEGIHFRIKTKQAKKN
ncbi:unnamed protein product [Arabidopsis thaliana]|uniref:(thale cress) hypothetical protein n=1 Tax=Arabidopsis thaliana TaxID=3702 RepID=A0A7G2EXJ5_ARATH|nr:unnamed protein product [Arabidopsis thaliana]